MKAIAIAASVVIHLGGLLAVPADPPPAAPSEPSAAVAISRADTCKCDLEVSADCSGVR